MSGLPASVRKLQKFVEASKELNDLLSKKVMTQLLFTGNIKLTRFEDHKIRELFSIIENAVKVDLYGEVLDDCDATVKD